MPKKKQKYIKKNLIIDAAGDKIIFKIIDDSKNYTNEYENSRKNFDKFAILLFKFMNKNIFKSGLYIVSLPIGNLNDITSRAKETISKSANGDSLIFTLRLDDLIEFIILSILSFLSG